MASEGNAQGIDDLLDDIPENEEVVEETVQETEQPETPVEAGKIPVETETEVADKQIEETESQVAKLFEPKEHLKETAPVSEVVKQRKLKQEAIARAEAAEAKLAQQQTVDTQPLDELTGLLAGDDDEVIEKKDLRKVVEKLPQTIAQIATQTTNQALTEVQTRNIAAKAQADEVAFRKDHQDYDAKVAFVAQRKLLNNEDLQEIFASPNIAEAYYAKANAAIEAEKTILGMPSQPQPNNVQQPTETAAQVGDDDPLDDEAGFEMFMGGGQQVS
jgi:hypothetical protein